MMHDNGNAVPQSTHAQPHNKPGSDSGSYSASSSSYSESETQHDNGHAAPSSQQPQTTVPTSPQLQQRTPTSQSQRAAHTADGNAPSTSRSQPPPPQQRMDESDDGGGEPAADSDNGEHNRGRGGKARQMLNATLSGPAAKMREISANFASRDSQRVTIYVFFMTALVHLLFVILSCTLSQIDISGGGCYTYWGYKADCDAVSYTNRTSLIKNCRKLRATLQTGAAFSILSIITSAATVVTAWMMCGRLRHAAYVAARQHRYRSVDAMTRATDSGNANGDKNAAGASAFNPGQLKVVTVIILVISIVFELIAWALIAGIATQQYCNSIYHWSTSGTYGVGFGLGLTAWILEILVAVVYVSVV